MQDKNTPVEAALDELTSTIVNSRGKPHLRSTLKAALLSEGYDEAEVMSALDTFFIEERTLQ